MSKIAPKSSSSSRVLMKMLYCEDDSRVLESQRKLFETAGFAVERAVGRKAGEEALRTARYDLVVLGHTLTKDDRHHLPYMAKKFNPGVQVLVLHASGKHPAVDLAIDSRTGEKAILAALASLSEMKIPIAS